MIFVMDAAGQCALKGEEWTKLTGQPLEKSGGVNWLTRVHPDDREIVRRTIAKALEGTHEFSLRFRLLQPDDQPCWVVTGYIPAVGPPNTPFLGYLGSLTRLADSATDGLTAYGNIGRFVPPPPHDSTQPLDHLDQIADHLILAHALIENDGVKAALPGLQQALFEVGCALAARMTRRPVFN